MGVREQANTEARLSRHELKRLVWELRWRELLTCDQVKDRLTEMGHVRHLSDGTTKPWSMQVVHKWWQEAEAEAQQQFLERTEALRAFAVGGHLRLHREAVDAWERSKGGLRTARDKRVKLSEELPAAPGRPPASRMAEARVEEFNELKDAHGDPRYLAEARANLVAAVEVAEGKRRPAPDLPPPGPEDALDDALRVRILDVLASSASRNGHTPGSQD